LGARKKGSAVGYDPASRGNARVLPFKLLYHPDFCVDLGPHVFPAQKYRLVRERLLGTGVAAEADFQLPTPASDDDVLRVHTPEYVRKLKTGELAPDEARALEVPWSRALVDAVWLAAGAAVEAGRLARRDGCALVLGGGFHHAFPDHGEGFCLINDVAVALAALRAAGEVTRVAVVDLDVHHGNGTAACFAKDPQTFTLSLHQENNYPAWKPPSRMDVGLPDGVGDDAYLAALRGPLAEALAFRPDLVFYLAGADPYQHDLLGGLGLTLDGLRERDRCVFRAARDAGVGVAVTLAGGYAARTGDTVEIHVNTVRAAAEAFGPTAPA
jgi:acetoin utilization deacetylase AcuC-like enzyme